MNSLPEDLAFKIIYCFQGYPRKRRHIIEEARNASDFEFFTIMKNEREILNNAGLETDIKSIINLAETCKFFYNLIRKSDMGKIIWVSYYNSIFPLQIKQNSVHIGTKNWLKCGPFSGEKFTGVENMKDPVEYRCSNPIHYVNNERRSGLNLDTDALFKKISIRQFVLMKNEAPDFRDYHQIRLDSLLVEYLELEAKIDKLNRRKRLSQLPLDKYFEYWISEKQASSYREQKLLCQINERETKISQSSEMDAL